jgi:hypothetical protein
MNVLVELDAEDYASLTDQPASACEGVVVTPDAERQPLAVTLSGNPLHDVYSIPSQLPCEHLVLWSGTLGDELFEAHPHNWMPPGRAALDECCTRLGEGLEQSGRRICFRPHSRHVLSDPPSCLKFLDDHAGELFDIALAPALMFEPGMLDDIDDHLERMFAMLGPRCAMVLLRDVTADEDGDMCVSVPLGRGRMPRDLVGSLIERCVPAATPIVLTSEELREQAGWLGATAAV